MRFLLPFFLIFFLIQGVAQTDVGLVDYYPLDTSFFDATGNTANVGIPLGDPEFQCGVAGNAMYLDGGGDLIYVPGTDNVNREFDTEDLTISFYFKSTGFDGTQYLMSKTDPGCMGGNNFFIRYVPLTRTINCFLSEEGKESISIVHKLDNLSCWQHLVVVRDGTRVRLYLNGEEVADRGSTSRLDVENNGNMIIGGSPCFSSGETYFEGFIDEFRVYNRALDIKEIKGLYFSPDQIINKDTLIYLGNPVQISLTKSCAVSYLWTPSQDFDNASAAEPEITPLTVGENHYTVRMQDGFSSCIAFDSLRITVVDPYDVECGVVFLPKAFTPNGDGLNETYGISNPFSIQELISFEIFDRWGNRIFFTNDPFYQWDGEYAGKQVNSGVFLYKVNYKCDGVEKFSSGSLTVIR